MNQKSLFEFIRFAVVGSISTVINYSIFFFLFQFAEIHYLLASAIGFVVGIFVSYFLNRAFTFKSSTENKGREFLSYLCVCLVSLGLSIFTLRIAVSFFMINPLLSNVFAICVSTFSNFFGAKSFVFRSR